MNSLQIFSEPSPMSTFVSPDLLAAFQEAPSGMPSLRDLATTIQLRLRLRPYPALPDEPYPFLAPYTHPDLLGGRAHELSNLRRLLKLPVPVLGLYGPAGVGISSLLDAGLVPALRAAGHPVAFVRLPSRGDLAGRLIGEILEPSGPHDTALRHFDEPGAFVDLLLLARRLAHKSVVLVVDQLEQAMWPGGDHLRGALGELLLATLRERSDVPFRWLLAYRQEAHGTVKEWLGDLDEDLSRASCSHFTSLPVLGGTPATDPLYEAERAFLDAIETPLAQRTADGEPFYPYRFAPGAALRLARFFAAERVSRPQAALGSELQAVLGRLLMSARRRSAPWETAVIEVDRPPAFFLGG